MKKFIAIALMVVASLSVSAEDLYIGGSVGYWHDDTADSDSFVIKPEIGYKINETWGVGATIGYTYAKTDVKAHLFEFAPYARYTYFRTGNDMLELFVDGGVGLGIGSTKYDDDSETAVYWNLGFRPGVAINITDKFTFETKFGFLGYQGADKNAEAAGIHKCGGLDFSTQQLTFGFFYNF